MRKFHSVLAIAFMGAAFAGPAEADRLGNGWDEKRTEWNAVGDKAAAGDRAALRLLEQTVAACRGANASCDNTSAFNAAVAAANLAWLYRHGKGVPTDASKVRELTLFAAAVERPSAPAYPVAWYNLANYYRDGHNGLPKNPQEAQKYLEYAASGGVAAAALEIADNTAKYAARTPNEALAENSRKTAVMNYEQVLAFNPTAEQRERASKGLSEMKRRLAAASAPPIDAATVNAARACISDASDDARTGSRLRSAATRLEARRKELRSLLRDIENSFNFIPSGPEGDAARRVANNNVASYNADMRDFDADFKQHNRDVSAHNRDVEQWESRCVSGFQLTRPEFDQVCGNNASNKFCKNFSFK
ncbi:MAG: hypothetical protein RIE56_09840 [Amphiplicatus sp.]